MTNSTPLPDAIDPIKLNYQPIQPRSYKFPFIALALLGATLSGAAGLAIGISLIARLGALVIPSALVLLFAINYGVCGLTRNRGFLVGSLIAGGVVLLLLGICLAVTGGSEFSPR
jgi:hypothetical protein